MEREREYHYGIMLREKFERLSSIRFLEIGAGGGINVRYFLESGILPENMVLNELLPERQEMLIKNYPNIKLHKGDATEMSVSEFGLFDLIFQSLVFTSILSDEIRKSLASCLWTMLKPGGAILWYDFVYDNPANPDVKGINLRAVKNLFPNAFSYKSVHVTLAPPIGRRVGRLYPVFNLFCFLRTHRIVLIEKAKTAT